MKRGQGYREMKSEVEGTVRYEEIDQGYREILREVKGTVRYEE
jgi:hypothetical protein